MNADEIVKTETVNTTLTIDYLSGLSQENIKKILAFTKNVQGTHSEKWSQLFDFLSENKLDKNYTTKILKLIEFGCMSSLVNILVSE